MGTTVEDNKIEHNVKKYIFFFPRGVYDWFCYFLILKLLVVFRSRDLIFFFLTLEYLSFLKIFTFSDPACMISSMVPKMKKIREN